MRLQAISWLVVLISCGICLCDDGYFNYFKGLCGALLKGTDGYHSKSVKDTWDRVLNTASEKIFHSLDMNEELKAAEDRCDKLKIDNDSICAFRDLKNIGNLIEPAVHKLREMFDPLPFHNLQYYTWYFGAWMRHPRFEKCNFEKDFVIMFAFIDQLFELESFNASFKIASVYSNVISKGLRQEIDRLCPILSTEKFCMLKIRTNIADKVEKLLTYVGRDQWDNKALQILKTAMKLYLSAVKLKVKKFDPSNSYDISTVPKESYLYESIQQITFYIFDSFQKNQIESIIQVVELLTDGFYLACDTNTVLPSIERTICSFSSMIDALSVYYSVKSSRVNIKQIRTGIKYETFLREKKLEDILKIGEATKLTVELVAERLSVEMKQNLGELKNYFQRIASFDLEMARSDIEDIEITLKKYKFASEQSSKKMDNLSDEIIKGALVATIGDSAEALLKLSFKIAEACNPLRAIFGDGIASDLFEAAQELSRSLVGVTKAATLSKAFVSLVSRVKTFVYKLSKNDRYLATVASLINNLKTVTSSSSSSSSSLSIEFEAQKNEFLREYNNFTPSVRKDELREITAYWENVVEEGCNILESTYGITASVTQIILSSKGSCFKAKVEVQKLITIYEEIYDFQFALLDSLANCMRAWTSYQSANLLNAARLKNDDNPDTLATQLSAAFSMISNKISVMAAIYSYCDILEYLEGHRPQECVGTKTDITSLLSRSPKKCTTLEGFKVIPTKPSKLGDKAYISLEDMYAGKSVAFKIPDSQWLIDHKWILPIQRHDTMFVQKFEIFLPVVTKWKKQVHVKAQAAAGNQVTAPNGTEYVISPAPILTYVYEEGKVGHECRLNRVSNPYNDECRDMPDICPLTKDFHACTSRGEICPSIYVQWNITVHGYENANLVVPTTDTPLLAGIQLCVLPQSTDAWRQRKDFNYETSKRLYPVEHRQNENGDRCCQSNQYYNESERTCTACPSGTVAKYKGLFCGRMIRFVPAPTKKTTFSFGNAKSTCINASSNIASAEDIKKAVALGDDSCGCGWLSDGTAVAPKPKNSCEENYGDSTFECHSDNTWGVYCLNNF